MSAAKNWVFTINNWTADDEIRLENAFNFCNYLVYGREIGDSGTPHLQGFMQLKDRKRMSQVKHLIGSRVHVEVARGTAQQASNYCKKDEDFTEFGHLVTTGIGLTSRRGRYPLWFWIDI